MAKQLELWGIDDVAEYLSIPISTAWTRRHRGQLPEPEWIVSNRPVWRATAIRQWAKRRKVNA